MDGAVVVTVDGYIHEQMVRLKDLSSADLAAIDADAPLEYADWMGSRQMNALDTSLREEVIAALTLSEENGRVTTFEDGDYANSQREEIASEWRSDE